MDTSHASASHHCKTADSHQAAQASLSASRSDLARDTNAQVWSGFPKSSPAQTTEATQLPGISPGTSFQQLASLVPCTARESSMPSGQEALRSEQAMRRSPEISAEHFSTTGHAHSSHHCKQQRTAIKPRKPVSCRQATIKAGTQCMPFVTYRKGTQLLGSTGNPLPPQQAKRPTSTAESPARPAACTTLQNEQAIRRSPEIERSTAATGHASGSTIFLEPEASGTDRIQQPSQAHSCSTPGGFSGPLNLRRANQLRHARNNTRVPMGAYPNTPRSLHHSSPSPALPPAGGR